MLPEDDVLEQRKIVNFSFWFRDSRQQRSLRSCGFINVVEQQLAAESRAALETVHPVWRVVLEQVPPDPQLACSLLATSRGMRSTVKLLYKAKLSVHLCFDTEEKSHQMLPLFGRWLPRHAALLHRLDASEVIQASLWELERATERFIARAFWEAGSSLQLQSLEVYNEVLVQQAAALASLRQGLTALAFHPQGGMTGYEAQPTVDALSQLTALRSLRCFANGPRSINKLLPAVAGLTNLTFLSAGFNRRADVGKYLPVSLVELQIGSAPRRVDPGSDDEVDHYWDAGSYLPPMASGGAGHPFVYSLGHLTAVTSLDYLWESDQEEWEALYLGDELPPNTQDLWAAVEHGGALAVLHPLTQLTWLDLRHSRMQASHLRSLTVLRNLEGLYLKEYNAQHPLLDPVETPSNYCEAWPLLPLDEIKVNGVVTPHVLEMLAKLTSITELQLEPTKGSSATLDQLAAALKQLQQLRELRLDWILSSPADPNTWYGPQEGLKCAKALSYMQDLSCLCLRHINMPREAAPCFAELQDLTRLELASCSIDDYFVTVIALQLTGLEVLCLQGNKQVTDVCLPTVSKLMQKLHWVGLSHTCVTGMGLAWLKQLPLLRTVCACGCNTSDADLSGLVGLSDWCGERDCPKRAGR